MAVVIEYTIGIPGQPEESYKKIRSIFDPMDANANRQEEKRVFRETFPDNPEAKIMDVQKIAAV